jgi:hypothetical protein
MYLLHYRMADSFNSWFDSRPSPGLCLKTYQPHGYHYRLEVLGLGVLELFIPHSMAEGRLWVSQIGQPGPERA